MFSSASADPTAASPAGASDASNPFAIVLDHQPTARQRMVRAVRFLLLVAALTAAVLAVTWQGKRMLVGYLSRDLDQLSAERRRERLIQLAALGTDGLPVLTRQLFSSDDETSETCYALMRSLQDDWILTPQSESQRHHFALVRALDSAINRISRSEHVLADPPVGNAVGDETLAVDLPRQRARARDLLQRTIIEFAEPVGGPEPTGRDGSDGGGWSEWLPRWTGGQEEISAPEVRQLAEATVDRLMFRSIGVRSEGTEVARVVPASRHKVLPENATPGLTPAEHAQSAAPQLLSRPTQWTDWPPPTASSDPMPPPMPKLARPTWRASPADMPVARETVSAGNTTPDLANGVRPVPDGETIALSSPHQADRHPFVDAPHPNPGISQTAANLTQSPMTAMATETILQHLGHPEPQIARWAEEELRQRGMGQIQLRFARQMVTARPADRITLVDSLMAESTENLYPWLAIALEDADRSVRLHVVSKLATVDQPEAKRLLQLRLQQEDDPQVATRIRQALDLR